MLRRALPIFFLAMAFSLAWASTSVQLNLPVYPANPAAGGRVAVVESIDQTVTIVEGKAQKVYGKSIFKIYGIAAGKANNLLIHVLLLDPDKLGKVFGNPKAYINVTVSDCEDTPGNVYAWGILSEDKAEVYLKPQGVPSNIEALYVQVTIAVPKGQAPPGQQLENKFYCMIEVLDAP